MKLRATEPNRAATEPAAPMPVLGPARNVLVIGDSQMAGIGRFLDAALKPSRVKAGQSAEQDAAGTLRIYGSSSATAKSWMEKARDGDIAGESRTNKLGYFESTDAYSYAAWSNQSEFVDRDKADGTVGNAAFRGRHITVDDMLDDQTAAPDVVIVALGTNNTNASPLNAVTSAVTQAKEMVDKILAKNPRAHIVWVGPYTPDPSKTYPAKLSNNATNPVYTMAKSVSRVTAALDNELCEYIAEKAPEAKFTFINGLELAKGLKTTRDNIHFDAANGKRLAERLASRLKALATESKV